MKIHEYQGKAVLKKYGVAVPRGSMATTREEAEAIAKELMASGATGVVVKAQITPVDAARRRREDRQVRGRSGRTCRQDFSMKL